MWLKSKVTIILRDILRQATAVLHARLDSDLAVFDFENLMAYRMFLDCTGRALPGIEQDLETSGVETLLPDWPERRRRTALAEDLRGLGLAPAPLAAGTSQPLSRAQMLGTLYVLEGSRLGATVLARQAETSSSPAVKSNVRYLSHGKGLRFWPSFQCVLNAAAVSPDEQAAATRSAKRAFEIFIRAFESRKAMPT